MEKILLSETMPNTRRRLHLAGTLWGRHGHPENSLSEILYDDYKRFMNYWTSSNEDLDLCRYRGVTLYFFRDPDVDFIILINTTPPFVDTEITGPSIHPGMLALNKRARFIPSLKTRPGRRHIVKIKVGAPQNV